MSYPKTWSEKLGDIWVGDIWVENEELKKRVEELERRMAKAERRLYEVLTGEKEEL
jgi:hypothetical protein